MSNRQRNLLLTLGVAVGSLVAFFLGGVRFAETPLSPLLTVVILFAIVPTALVYIWWRDLWLSAIVTLIALAACSMLIVAWSLLLVPIQELTRKQFSPYQSASTTLSADHAGLVTVYSDTATLQLTVQSNPPLTQTLPVTVTIDPRLSFGAILVAPRTVAITRPQATVAGFIFTPTTLIQTATLRLVNNGTEPGSIAPWVNLPTADLTLTVGGDTPTKSKVELETIGRATLRSFINSELGERSPLVLLIASMLGLVAGFYLQRERKRDQDDAQRKHDQERAQAQLELVCAHLRAGALQEAERHLRQLSDSELNKYVPEGVERARHLLAFGKDQTKYPEVELLLRQWPEEVAGALCAFATALKDDQSVPPELYRALRRLPLDRIPETERVKVHNARRRCGIRELQPKEWPLMKKSSGQRQKPAAHTWRDLHIFPARKAEQDEQLFDQDSPTFFPHPLCERLIDSRASSIVWGTGSGRTALARGIGLFHRNPKTLGCTLAGMPSGRQIGRAFAWQMLSYIVYHPTRLVSLSDDERSFCVACCTTCLSDGLVLARINREEQERKRNPPWKDPQDAAKRALWEHEAETQTALLRADVATSGQSAVFPDGDWAQPLCEAARLLGFASFRVAFDVVGNKWTDWAANLVDANLTSWTEADLAFTLLVPGPPPLAFADQIGLPCEELHWRPPDNVHYPLEEMLNNRCRSMLASPVSLEDFFEHASGDVSPLRAIQELVQYDLQRLMKVWHHLQKEYPTARRVSLDTVEAFIRA